MQRADEGEEPPGGVEVGLDLSGEPRLEELGSLSDPPMTKDAVAGRIRRLLAMADKRAVDEGIPNTEAAVTPEMLAP